MDGVPVLMIKQVNQTGTHLQKIIPLLYYWSTAGAYIINGLFFKENILRKSEQGDSLVPACCCSVPPPFPSLKNPESINFQGSETVGHDVSLTLLEKVLCHCIYISGFNGIKSKSRTCTKLYIILGTEAQKFK